MPSVLIVGGCGFVGQSLACALIENADCSVCLADLAPLPESLSRKSQITYQELNILDRSRIDEVFGIVRPDIVIHLASSGMSGIPMILPVTRTINVEGTENLLHGCLIHKVSMFLYTSSYNVIFGGQAICGGDETMDYYPKHKHSDFSSSSKATAESIVLSHHGRAFLETDQEKQENFEDDLPRNCLSTAVIRPAAIYGEHEQRHLPRIIRLMDNGLFAFRIGKAVVDWVHVENLVSAYVALIERMQSEALKRKVPFTNSSGLRSFGGDSMELTPHRSVGGQCYFISDGTPIDNFEFLRPLCEARGRQFPSLVIPTYAALHIARATEWFYHATSLSRTDSGSTNTGAVGGVRDGSIVWDLMPPIVESLLLTRAEVLKVGVTHYFSIEKARRDLGYAPKISSQEGARRLAAFYGSREQLASATNYFAVPSWYWWFLVLFGMSMLGIVAFKGSCCDKPSGGAALSHYHALYFYYLDQLALLIFRERLALQILFCAAVATHFAEAVVAYRKARSECGRNTCLLWCLQTFILGYPSLALLYARQKFVADAAPTGAAGVDTG